MEKRKWAWKKKPSERSPGNSESSGSVSSHSERYFDEQDVVRESPKDIPGSPEISSEEAARMEEEAKEIVKSLTDKLSAALVNISAKEDLVKQHAKVAEEAVAGWEKAENEVAVLKNQLESSLRNQNLDVRASHLEKQITDALQHQRKEWDTQKSELERENSSLKQELRIMTIERDLTTRAAENASRLQLESIKRIAKFEAECRRLQSVARKSAPIGSQKSFGVSSFYADSFTDNNSCMSSNTGSEHNSSPKNLTVEIDMMDDFLEMERIASMSGTEENTVDSNPLSQHVEYLDIELKKMEKEKLELRNALDECEESLKAALSQMAVGETKLAEMEKEVRAIRETKELLEFQLSGVEVEAGTLSGNLESLKAELEEERRLSARLTAKCRELEGTLSGNAESLKAEIEEERKLSAGLAAKCRELEGELTQRIQNSQVDEKVGLDVEPHIKEEDLAVAADKLVECQKTIASLGRQLESLATLEDFLIDTSSIPGFSKVDSATGGEMWRSPCRDYSDVSRMSSMENPCRLAEDSHSLRTRPLPRTGTGLPSFSLGV